MTEETITEFKRDVVDPMLAEPESGGLSLNDVGNGDEWWFDLNKILQSKTVGPRGEEHRQEVPGERSAHVTVFSGALGYESSRMDRLAELGMAPAEVPAADSLSERARETLRRRPTSLDELKGHDSDLISDDEMAWLDTLSLDTWDSADFFLYPVLVLFARSSGPNPDWTKHCKSEKMLAGTTHDGWMDEASKLLWYEFTRAYPYSPFGNTGRRIIDQRDQHFSNETVKQSLMQEQDNNVGVGTPGHHTAALQHMDQRGGPIQHANAFLRPLVRREQRSKGTIDESGMMRIIEIAVAASHTPKIFSYASRRVGWGEDASGKLCYDPMKTCDKTVLTVYIAPSTGAHAMPASFGDAQEGEAGRGIAPAAAAEASPETTLAAPAPSFVQAWSGKYRSSEEFMRIEGSAAQLAAATVKDLFTSVVSDSEDSDEGEEGSNGEKRRKKRGGGRRCQKGVIISKLAHRQKKDGVQQAKSEKEQKAKDALCSEYGRVQNVLSEYAALTEKHAFLKNTHSIEQIRTAKPKITVPQLKLYLEVRTKKKPSTLSEKLAVEEVVKVMNHSIDLREGSVPDGFAMWKEREHERLKLAAAAAAAAAAAPLAITMVPDAASSTEVPPAGLTTPRAKDLATRTDSGRSPRPYPPPAPNPTTHAAGAYTHTRTHTRTHATGSGAPSIGSALVDTKRKAAEMAISAAEKSSPGTRARLLEKAMDLLK